jgi:hypothetical protein
MNYCPKYLSACLLGIAALASGAFPAFAANPVAVPLGSADTYALTTSSGLTTSGVTNFGGNVAMDAPTSTCTATNAPNGVAVVVLAGKDACGMNNSVANTINPAINNSNGLTITGTTIRFNPGVVNSDAFNATVRAVKNDVNAAWVNAAGRPAGTGANLLAAGTSNLDGLVLLPGVYTSLSTMGLSGGATLTLRGSGVWIFQVGSSLTIAGGTAGPTRVVLENGALATNVFWQVVSDVTIGGGTGGVANQTIFKGTILAGTSVTFSGVNGTAVEGRVLAGANLSGPPNTLAGLVSTTSVGGGNSVTVTLPAGTQPPPPSCDTDHRHHKHCKHNEHDKPHCDGDGDHDGHDGHDDDGHGNGHDGNDDDNGHGSDHDSPFKR